MGHSAATEPLAGVLGLPLSLHQMHVDIDVFGARGGENGLERRITQPVEIRRREVEANPVGSDGIPALSGADEERHQLVDGNRRFVEPLPKPVGGFDRQGGEDIGVILIGQNVLVADHEGVTGPHADFTIGTEHLVGGGVPGVGATAKAAMDVVHGRRAALQHLDGRVEGIKSQPDAPHGAKLRQPEFERREGHAQHQRGEAGMVVAVDETRHGDVTRGPNHRHARMPRAEFGRIGHLGDKAVCDPQADRPRGLFQPLRRHPQQGCASLHDQVRRCRHPGKGSRFTRRAATSL